MSIRHDGRLSKDISHDQVRTFSSDSRQGQKLLKGRRHMTVVLFLQNLHTDADIPGFAMPQAAGLHEIHVDTENYVTALRAALRQSPDVILLGEMRDYETINVAMTAAETGHLLLSTLHTIGAANTIDRIIDVFPPSQQHQIAIQLSTVLNAVVSQQLLPTVDGRMVPAFEIMTVTPAIRNMIRENKVPQIEGVLYSSNREDMVSMDVSILSLYQEGLISKETALIYATNPEMLKRKL